MDEFDRRAFLKTMGSATISTAFPTAGFGASPVIVQELAQPSPVAGVKPTQSVRFSVAGMSHDHIYGMVEAMIRGGGVLVSVYAAEPERVAAFLKRYPQAKQAQSEDEILNDSSIHLVLSSAIPNQRAPLGVRVMKRQGLSERQTRRDHPGATRRGA